LTQSQRMCIDIHNTQYCVLTYTIHNIVYWHTQYTILCTDIHNTQYCVLTYTVHNIVYWHTQYTILCTDVHNTQYCVLTYTIHNIVYWHTQYTTSSNEQYKYLDTLEARCRCIDLINNFSNYKTGNVLKKVTLRHFHLSIFAVEKQ